MFFYALFLKGPKGVDGKHLILTEFQHLGWSLAATHVSDTNRGNHVCFLFLPSLKAEISICYLTFSLSHVTLCSFHSSFCNLVMVCSLQEENKYLRELIILILSSCSSLKSLHECKKVSTSHRFISRILELVFDFEDLLDGDQHGSSVL